MLPPQAPSEALAIDHDYFKDVTAVFCICDAAAIGLINRFTERGLKVPDDISVTGFDDITIASLVSPSLTTIASNKVRLANGALELLQWQLQSAASSDEEQGSAHKIIKAYQNVELVERQSVKNLAM